MMSAHYKNFSKILLINRLVVLGVILCCTIISTVAIYLTNKTYNKALNFRYAVNTDGSIIPLKLLEERENFEVELLSHLNNFHNYFYNLSPTNYKSNIDKALWLGNKSVSDLYKEKQAKSVYNDIIQYSLIYNIDDIKIDYNSSKEPYRFKATIKLSVLRGESKVSYLLITTGSVIHVDRNFPYNTHGLLITNFYEEKPTIINTKEDE